MKASIQIKLLALCILLVLLTAVSISATYYVLTKQDKHRESRQRIKIAFDIIHDDMTNRLQTYTSRFDEFLKRDERMNWITRFYNQEKSQVGSSQFIVSSP